MCVCVRVCVCVTYIFTWLAHEIVGDGQDFEYSGNGYAAICVGVIWGTKKKNMNWAHIHFPFFTPHLSFIFNIFFIFHFLKLSYSIFAMRRTHLACLLCIIKRDPSICIHINTHTHTQTRTHIFTYICTYIYMYNLHTRTHVFTYICTYIYMYNLHTYVHTYTCITYVHTYTCITSGTTNRRSNRDHPTYHIILSHITSSYHISHHPFRNHK